MAESFPPAGTANQPVKGRHISPVQWEDMSRSEAQRVIRAAKLAVPDILVRLALRAYESLLPGTGRDERMRAALAAVKGDLYG